MVEYCPSPSAPKLLKSVGMLWWPITTIHLLSLLKLFNIRQFCPLSHVFFKVLMKIIVCSYHKYKVAFVYILWFSIFFVPFGFLASSCPGVCVDFCFLN